MSHNAFRRKMSLLGSNAGESLARRGEQRIIRDFHKSRAYKEGFLTTKDLKKHDLPFRMKNISKSTDNKKIELLPNSYVEIGDYISYIESMNNKRIYNNIINSEEKFYLIDEFEQNSLSPIIKGIYCNEKITCKDFKGVYLPCTFGDNSYGSKGLIAESDQLYNFDSRIYMRLQDNELSQKIYEGERFIFNHKDVYEITKTMSAEKIGTVKLIARYSRIKTEDNFENNIAWNYKDNNDSTIKINYKINSNVSSNYDEEIIYVGEEIEYSIYPYINCNFELDVQEPAKITYSNGGVCRIKAIMPNETIRLIAKDSKNNVLAIKPIFIIE